MLIQAAAMLGVALAVPAASAAPAANSVISLDGKD
jgi:hypothetical protein